MSDVAALAGVSLKTVSRVVNEEPGVSPDVRERVTAAVNRLDYRPNLAASNLRRTGARTGLIGALVQDLSNSFSASLLRALEDSRTPARHGGARGQPRRGRRPRAGARPRPGDPPGRRPGDHARERAPGLPRQRAALRHPGRVRRPPAARGRRRLGHRRQPSRWRGWRASTCWRRATAGSPRSSTSRPSPRPRDGSPGSPTPTPSAACGRTRALVVTGLRSTDEATEVMHEPARPRRPPHRGLHRAEHPLHRGGSRPGRAWAAPRRRPRRLRRLPAGRPARPAADRHPAGRRADRQDRGRPPLRPDRRQHLAPAARRARADPRRARLRRDPAPRLTRVTGAGGVPSSSGRPRRTSARSR